MITALATDSVIAAKSSLQNVCDVPLQNGQNPLLYAIIQGKREAIQSLLDQGANPDAVFSESFYFPKGTTALQLAASLGDEEAIRSLLTAGADRLLQNSEGVDGDDYLRHYGFDWAVSEK